MYYSPEGLLRLFLTLGALVVFIYPGYFLVNGYYKRKGEDTSLPGKYEKTVWGGFLISCILLLVVASILSALKVI